MKGYVYRLRRWIVRMHAAILVREFSMLIVLPSLVTLSSRFCLHLCTCPCYRHLLTKKQNLTFTVCSSQFGSHK